MPSDGEHHDGRRRQQPVEREVERPGRVGSSTSPAAAAADRRERRPGLGDRRHHQAGRGDRFRAIDDGRDERRGDEPEAEETGDEAKHAPIGRSVRRERQSPGTPACDRACLEARAAGAAALRSGCAVDT